MSLVNDFKNEVYENGAADNLSLIIVYADGDKSESNYKVVLLVAAIVIIFILWLIANIIIKIGI